MVACDFDLSITFVSSGWEGLATDSRVLTSAMSKGFQVPPGKFYLVDGGYANTPSFLAPYRGVRYHLKEFGAGHRRPQNLKELFNHRHVLLRNHVERALGVLKKRFPILSHPVLEGKPNANHVRARIRTHVHNDYIIGHHHTMLELNNRMVLNYIKMSETSTESNTYP
jgi:hypothetical protein